MVDKLSFVKSPRSLRRSFKIFPVLCPILIGPLFHQGFHTNDGLDFLSAHGHGPIRPVRPRLLFLSPSVTNPTIDMKLSMISNAIQLKFGCKFCYITILSPFSKCDFFIKPCHSNIYPKIHPHDAYLQRSLRLNHSIPGTHFLTSYGVNEKHHRHRIQLVICANLSAFSCIIILLYSQTRSE